MSALTGSLRVVTRVRDRHRAALVAAVLTGGSAEILDFLLPLWAGSELGASPTQVGALLAVELVISFVARPVAGWLADTRERTRVAAVGALLYAASCLGYAASGSLPPAFLAAVAGGVGGALLWVSIRAIAAEFLAGDSGTFAGLFSAVALGSWFFWVPAMVLLGEAGYRGVFTALGVVCALVVVPLLLVPRSAPVPVPAGTPVRADLRRQGPLLGVVMLTAVAEAGVGLLLLLHLQSAFDLEVYQIALVFLPGGIAMTVLPRWLHRLVEVRGRRQVYSGASFASALFAASLALAPGPGAIAGLWVLTSAAWAALVPIQQAAVAEVSGARAGRGMSLLGNAALAGSAAGSLLAGALYELSSWQWVCIVFAVVIAAGAVLGPWALGAVGVRDRPVPPGG